MTHHPIRVNWWYESIVDWMLMNPHKTKADCAKFFNVSKQWIYVLSQSDVFKALYEERRKVHNGLVSGAVIEKTEALTEMALDHLTQRVAEQGDLMSPQFLKDVTEMGLEKLGYDGKYGKGLSPAEQPSQVQVNIVTVDALQQARAKMIERGNQIAREPLPPRPQQAQVHILRNPTPDTIIESFVEDIETDET